MSDRDTLLLEIAGYLRLVSLGVANKAEADELQEKIGAALSAPAGEGPQCGCDAAMHLEPGHRVGCPAGMQPIAEEK